ncbi:MAG: alpha-ketoglutarate-dependent dioxygenase AlkB [Pseudomonadota bacterium]
MTRFVSKISPQLPAGCQHLPGYFKKSDQDLLRTEVRMICEAAPLFRPTMPRSGKPFSVEMSNAGPLGWVSDKSGYRYQPLHPVTGRPWPPIPHALLELWSRVVPDAPEPEACLINVYGKRSKLGSHVDKDEADLVTPVVSVSLGDDAVFHIGGLRRSDPKVRLTLRSGDVAILGGAARLAYHGIDRIISGTSTLIGPEGGRINVTLRRVGQSAGFNA